MAEPPYVLDASAVLVAFFEEPGAEIVLERLPGARISAVNYHEVVAKLVDRGTPAATIVDIMARLDLVVVPFDREQALAAGLLRAETRGAGLSLGDRSCLALASTHDATAVTADRTWADLGLAIRIELVR